MSQSASKNKIANGLVSASCAAVLAVYAAGYARTQSAANRLAAQVAVRRAAVPESERTTVPMPGFGPALRERPSSVAIVQPRRVEPSHQLDRPADVPAPSPEISTSVSSPVESSATTPIPVASIATEVKAEPPAAVVEPKKEPAPVTPVWKDGVYRGWGYSRHGNIEAESRHREGPHYFRGDFPVPDALFLFRDRELASTSGSAAKSRSRLCLRSHAERRRFLWSSG